MALGDLFKLAKLTIEAYDTPERTTLTPAVGKTFEVQYNPETLSIRHETVFQDQQGIGTTSASGGFSHSRSKRLSVSLVIDGSNVGSMGFELLRGLRTVAQQIDDFIDICYDTRSETHEPAYLRLRWGDGVLQPYFDCRLQSVDINYTAFDRDGSPLHAELAAVFVEQLDRKRQAAKRRHSSPDLTHRRLVVEGDTLPLLCREIYGSAAYYLRVAQVNGLDDVKTLVPGQELIFPPLGRGDGTR